MHADPQGKVQLKQTVGIHWCQVLGYEAEFGDGVGNRGREVLDSLHYCFTKGYVEVPEKLRASCTDGYGCERCAKGAVGCEDLVDHLEAAGEVEDLKFGVMGVHTHLDD
jgi:hypothetical protein